MWRSLALIARRMALAVSEPTQTTVAMTTPARKLSAGPGRL